MTPLLFIAVSVSTIVASGCTITAQPLHIEAVAVEELPSPGPLPATP